MYHLEICSTGSSLRTKEEILDETLDSNHVLKDKKVSSLYSMNIFCITFDDFEHWLVLKLKGENWMLTPAMSEDVEEEGSLLGYVNDLKYRDYNLLDHIKFPQF